MDDRPLLFSVVAFVKAQPITDPKVRALGIQAATIRGVEVISSGPTDDGSGLFQIFGHLTEFAGWTVTARFEMTDPPVMVALDFARFDHSPNPTVLPISGADPGPIRSAMLQEVHLGELIDQANFYLALGRWAVGQDVDGMELISRPGRPVTYSDFEVALCAKRVVDARAGSTRPNVDVANEYYDDDDGLVREHLRRARNRRLMTSPGVGRTDGTLTPKALRILAGETPGASRVEKRVAPPKRRRRKGTR